MSFSKFGRGLTIQAVPRKVTGFGHITKDGLSIGPDGLTVDGVRVSTLFNSFSDLVDTDPPVVLGSGVSGSVRKAKHRTTGKVYAVKTMQLEASEEFIEKKLVELKTLMASDHPNIVGFHGAFYNDGVLSFVLEYMDRGTIADLLAKVKAIPLHVLAKMTYELLQGLNYLHKKLHLIHRDFKPQNILLNSSGAIKITDFGVSGEIANSASFLQSFVGTLKYMSPSRIKGQKHSSKSDLWSFGIVVLECALGEYPYGPDDLNVTFFARMNEIVNKPIPKPDAAKFPADFCSFIGLCLQKEEDKLPDAASLLEHAWVVSVKDTDITQWLAANS